MGFGLEHRQTVVVRTDAALEEGVAVEQQVMGRDGGGDPIRGVLDEAHGVAGGDVLDHDAQAVEALEEASEGLLEEDSLTLEDVAVGIDAFPVDQERQPARLHRLEHRPGALEARQPGLRVGGRSGGIELHRVHEVARYRALDVFRRGGGRQVEGS